MSQTRSTTFVHARRRNDAIRRLLPRAAVLVLAAVAVALVLAAVSAHAGASRTAALEAPWAEIGSAPLR